MNPRYLQSRFPVYSILLAICLMISFQGSGQDSRISIAKQLSYDKKYKSADSVFQQILRDTPNDLEARLGSAYNHSWAHNLNQALLEFEQILKTYPENKSALIGYGYTLAWSEDYANAKYPFLNALKYYPHDIEAEKGLAYVYLWQRSPDVAIDMFEKLLEKDPANPEFYVALTYAHVQKFETIEARKLVQHAISLDPTNKEYKELESSLEYATPFMEVDIAGGYSRLENESRYGLRTLQLSAQLSQSIRALLSYDNTMSLDNFFFVDQNLQAQSFLGGAIITWDKYNSSRLQTGLRDLEEQGSQWLFLGEHALLLKDNKIVKAGGLYASGDQAGNEWMLYAGLNIPLGKKLRFEPVYYVSRRHLSHSPEHRLALNTQFKGGKGFEIGGGVYYGMLNAVSETSSRNVYGAYISALFPVHRVVWLTANLKHEVGVIGTYQIASVGAKIRFEK